MPLDPSILLGAQPIQAPDPLNYAIKGMTLGNLASEMGLRNMQMQQSQRTQAAMDAANRVLPEVMAGGWSPQAIQAAIQKEPASASLLLDALDKKRQSDAAYGKTQADTFKSNTEAKSKALNDIGTAAYEFAQKPSPNALPMLQSMAKFYGVELPQYPGDPRDPQALQEYFRTMGNAAYAVKDRVANTETNRANLVNEVQRGANYASEAKSREAQTAQGWARFGLEKENAGKPVIQTTTEGDVFAINPRTAVGQRVTDATGAPLNKGQKALTEAQGTATTYAMRMRDARSTIDQLESAGAVDPSGVLVANAGESGWAGTPMNAAVGAINPQAQVYEQAKRNWVTANLRKESGAAIPPEEMAQDMRKWFPVVGDRPEVIAAKRAAREVAERAMIVQAGPGSRNVPDAQATPSRSVSGSIGGQLAPPKLGEKRDGYIYKGGDPADPKSWEK